ncbi:Meiotically protein [Penicillium taxi]|uniref:Meiotically protein n=1 Tax=Penicillium taxi TaxID=168475 RepID=UPI00254527DB|nr:Meiotically protein [Penicillium taxi]KAJ5888134.1 Meiotically protein [Penicillium taxi]
MQTSTSISLVDNTIPSQQPTSRESSRQPSTDRHGSLKKHLSRTSVSGQLAKRKYAKWQPERLGLATDGETSPSRDSSRARGSISAESSSAQLLLQETVTDASRVSTTASDPFRVQPNENGQSAGQTIAVNSDGSTKPHSELDILYENQRGSFFFGVPLYSHSSLLSIDPDAWMTHDHRDSPVNITNAQVPDPSWEWSWRTWYVDMSGDVDEQGWQYAFSFGSSQWHGTHPWFHSFARRRRWVRLRNKISQRRHRGRSEFERGHMLNEDYFTIHSSNSKALGRAQSVTGLSRVESGFLSLMSMKEEEEMHLDEIGNIPSLMAALKQATIDRERIDALKRFVEDGGEELYYLNDKIPEIMSMFMFQASRWQFVTHLVGVIHQLKDSTESDDKEADKITRKSDSLTRAVESARSHITGPDIFTDSQGESVTELLDLTPVSRHNSLLSRRSKATGEPLHVLKVREIKGIPKAAQVGREAHIY